MSKYFTERLTVGYAGKKSDLLILEEQNLTCDIPGCGSSRTHYHGRGRNLCGHHQSRMREYGGPGRLDRPYTFHKKTCCEVCGHNPWEHPMVKLIEDELVRDRVANGMLIVDHKNPQKNGVDHTEENTQTLCLDCNLIKTTLSCDFMPDSHFADKTKIESLKEKLRPVYEKIFDLVDKTV